jgi:hypothetical protein
MRAFSAGVWQSIQGAEAVIWKAPSLTIWLAARR